MTIVLYVLTGIALIQGAVALHKGIRNRNYARDFTPPPAGPPGRVIVFCPVRGRDPGLAESAASVLRQDFPDGYRVVFVVDAPGDPAVETLSPLTGGTPFKIFVAGRASGRGQKVHNLREAVRRFHDDGNVFVFCDADAVFPPTWLGDLTGSLLGGGVGAATGYRWYVSGNDGPGGGGRLASALRAAWNASIAGYFGPHSGNFAWGGSTGIRREVFDAAGVDDAWSGAISDDYALTRAVRSAGLTIRYVPTCLVPTYGRCGWRELLEFTTRQIKITRVYAPGVWRLAFVGFTVFLAAFGWLTLMLPVEPRAWIPWSVLYVLAGVRADVAHQAAQRSIDDPALARDRWLYRLLPPLAALLYGYNLWASLVSRRVAWKGIRYTMVAPDRTRVEGGGRPGVGAGGSGRIGA